MILRHICDVTPSAHRHINFFKPFHFFTAGDQQVVPIGATHISLPLHQIQLREQEKKKEQTNKRLGLTQVQKENYVTSCMCRLTLVWTLARLPQATGMPTRSSFTGLDPLSCRLVSLLSRVDCLCPSSVANCPLPVPFPNSLLASPYHLRSRRYIKSKTLCLVSRRNRQRNRLLGGPPT